MTEEDVTKAAVVTEEKDVLVHEVEISVASIFVQEQKEGALSMPRKRKRELEDLQAQTPSLYQKNPRPSLKAGIILMPNLAKNGKPAAINRYFVKSWLQHHPLVQPVLHLAFLRYSFKAILLTALLIRYPSLIRKCSFSQIQPYKGH